MPFTIAPPGNAHDFCKVNLRLHAAKIGAANDKRKKLLSLTINTKSAEEIGAVLGMQLLWIAVLFCAVTLVWHRGRNKIMIQGG